MVGVSKIFPPHKQVLKDIYLSFFYGAKIGIIGLNGSGKSTLLKIIAGVEKFLSFLAVFWGQTGFLPVPTFTTPFGILRCFCSARLAAPPCRRQYTAKRYAKNAVFGCVPPYLLPPFSLPLLTYRTQALTPFFTFGFNARTHGNRKENRPSENGRAIINHPRS